MGTVDSRSFAARTGEPFALKKRTASLSGRELGASTGYSERLLATSCSCSVGQRHGEQGLGRRQTDHLEGVGADHGLVGDAPGQLDGLGLDLP